jgi:hypothetical protein
MYNYKRFSDAPDIVRQLTICFDAFIVGSSPKYLLNKVDKCKDWDIIVPLSRWGQAQKLIPKEAIHNTFGGSKINVAHETHYGCGIFVNVDVWSCDLSEFLISHRDKEVYIVHPKSLFSGALGYGNG